MNNLRGVNVSPLEQEPEVSKALAKLLELLSEHETIKEFKKIKNHGN